MDVTSRDVDEYLARISHAGPRDPTLAVLREIHVAHMRAVPFGDGHRYRLDEVEGGLLLSRRRDATWERQYAFTLETWPLSAFTAGCRYHSTSPKSHFTQKTIVSRATKAGRVTLSERRLIVTEGGARREVDLADDDAVAAACLLPDDDARADAG